MEAKLEQKNGINDVHARVGIDFNNEIEEMKRERIKRGYDKKQRTTRDMSNLIVKHLELWPALREEIIEYQFEDEE